MIRASQVPPRCRPHYVTSRASIRCPLIDAASIRQKKNMYNNMMQMDLSRNDVEVSLALPTRTLNPDEVRQLLKRLYLTWCMNESSDENRKLHLVSPRSSSFARPKRVRFIWSELFLLEILLDFVGSLARYAHHISFVSSGNLVSEVYGSLLTVQLLHRWWIVCPDIYTYTYTYIRINSRCIPPYSAYWLRNSCYWFCTLQWRWPAHCVSLSSL